MKRNPLSQPDCLDQVRFAVTNCTQISIISCGFKLELLNQHLISEEIVCVMMLMQTLLNDHSLSGCLNFKDTDNNVPLIKALKQIGR